MSGIKKWHPFTVLSLAVFVVTAATAAGCWWLSCGVIGLCFLLSSRTRTTRKLAVLSGAIMLPTCISLLLIHGFVARDSSYLIYAWGPFSMTANGVEIALALGLRTAVLVVAGLLCSLVIDKHQLVAAIDLSPAPAQMGYLLAATLFLLPQMNEKQRVIGQAQRLRHAGTGGGARGWMQRMRLRAVPLVLSSLQDASDRSVHLAARGFPASGAHSRLRNVNDSRLQRVVRWTALLGAVLVPLLILMPVWGDS